MHILMMTNTYAPHVGGVARSIERFAERYRSLGHQVKIVAPEFDGNAPDENEVIRVPAIRHFNHTDFSLALPIPNQLQAAVEAYEPDVVHSHHPFLLGGTALRIAHVFSLPVVFTHHTKYEDYTHNVPGDSPLLKNFVIQLATGYANLVDEVFAPSESIAKLITERGVKTPVTVVPTGVERAQLENGNGARIRQLMGIPSDAFVVGHLGRLSKEKNLDVLCKAVLRFLELADKTLDARFMVFGKGPLENMIDERFREAGLANRLHRGGVVELSELADVYDAMDVFAFASLSETQGMVLTEAMTAGVPVVAIDAPGVREVVDDKVNGRLLPDENIDAFASALQDIASCDGQRRDALIRAARDTADRFSMENTARIALGRYESLQRHDMSHRPDTFSLWTSAQQLFVSERERLENTVQAAVDAARATFDTKNDPV